MIPSPRTTLLPKISASEAESLPYPPDVLPGGRWVESPYGAIRVYEWGPEDGRKVLLVHGISTPCISLGGIAHGLADRGCRVMMTDLFGRGYSDAPSDLPHDTRLYTTQILLAITSSPLSWTGAGNRFSIIGYSLGGGISASFTSYFPQLIDSLVLLAPAGLIRPHKFALTSKFLFSTGIFPERLLHYLVERRMRTSKDSAVVPQPKPNDKAANKAASPTDIIASELPPPIMSRAYPTVNVPRAIIWQLDHHQGFLTSFLSCVRYAPISDQHADWRRIGDRLSVQNAGTTPADQGLQNGQALIITGSEDVLVDAKELQPDANDVLGGPRNTCFKVANGGHNFPITDAETTLKYIVEFWGLGS